MKHQIRIRGLIVLCCSKCSDEDRWRGETVVLSGDIDRDTTGRAEQGGIIPADYIVTLYTTVIQQSLVGAWYMTGGIIIVVTYVANVACDSLSTSHWSFVHLITDQ